MTVLSGIDKWGCAGILGVMEHADYADLLSEDMYASLSEKGENYIIRKILEIAQNAKHDNTKLKALQIMWNKLRPDKSEVTVREEESPYTMFMREFGEEQEVTH